MMSILVRVSFILLVIFFLKGCSNLKKEHFKLGTIIKIEPVEKTVKFSDIFCDYDIVTLNKDSTILGDIKRLFVSEDKYIIQGKGNNSFVQIYDTAGNYIRSIGQYGRGPSEYVHTKGIWFEDKEKSIIVPDYYSRRILEFSINGKLRKVENINSQYFSRCAKVNDSIYALYRKDCYKKKSEYKLDLYSVSNKEVLNKYFEIDPQTADYLSFSEFLNFYKIQDTIRFYNVFTNNIYNVYADSISVKYSFDQGKYKLPEDKLNGNYKTLSKFLSFLKQSPYIWNVNNLLESRKYVFFHYVYRNNSYFCFYDKYARRSFSFDCFEDDVCLMTKGKIDNWPISKILMPLFMHKDKMYFSISAHEFIDAIESIKASYSSVEWKSFVMQHKKMIKKYNSLDINDNDVLLIYKFK